MTDSISVTYDTIDPTVLTEVVRLDQGSPDFVITDWTVRPLSDKGLANPQGLLLVSGHGQDSRGGRPWSVVLKKFTLEGPIANDYPNHLFYWKRELALSQSGLLERLPGPVAVPRCYGTAEWEGGGQVWLEHVHDVSQSRWTLDQYRFAARQLGRMSGTCVTTGFLPDEPWLCRDHVRQFVDVSVNFNRKEGVWVFDPRIEQAFSARALTGAIRLLDERETYFQIMKPLPQVFSHFDFSRRNLLVRKTADGRDELIALDWSFAGIGALGGELVSLVGVSALLFEIEPVDLPALEAAVYPEYLAGLHDAGWDGDLDLVRLAYTTWLALWCGASAPGFASFFGAENGPGILSFNCQPKEMIAGWGEICEFALERGEEARRLIQKFF